MALQPSEFVRRIILLMAEQTLQQARSNLTLMSSDERRARALREDLRIQILNVDESGAEALVLTDFYWAVYYHDGRGPISAKPGKFLVFFRDPRDDPRHNGGSLNYPKRAANVRTLRLTKGEFSMMLRTGRLIATKRVGPAEAHPFFDVGFASLQARYGPQVARAFGDCVVELLAADDLLNGREEATFSL